MEKFLGGNPLSVFLKLVIVSVVAGIVLSAMGYDPRDFLVIIPRLIDSIYRFGIRWADSVVDWFVLGAVIVIPIWVIIRVFKMLGGGNKGDAKR